MEENIIFGKVIVIGDVAVGKTCLIHAIFNNEFLENVRSTYTPAQTILNAIDFRGVSKKIEFWDTAGEERFKSITSIYYRNTNIAIICFDSTRDDPFTGAKTWADSLLENWATGRLIFVGTKADLISEEKQHEILERSDEAFKQYDPIDIVITSSKVKLNIESLKSLIINSVESLPIEAQPKVNYSELSQSNCC